MSISTTGAPQSESLGDHSADLRMIMLAGMSLIVGTGGAIGAAILLKLIALSTNIFWYARLSAEPASITNAHLGYGIVVMPVVGSLIIGVMARYGSEKIRGHGIPEAIETILFGESRLSLKVAILKPLSAAVSIGSGVNARGIMTPG